jgi:hypothetical protein
MQLEIIFSNISAPHSTSLGLDAVACFLPERQKVPTRIFAPLVPRNHQIHPLEDFHGTRHQRTTTSSSTGNFALTGSMTSTTK